MSVFNSSNRKSGDDPFQNRKHVTTACVKCRQAKGKVCRCYHFLSLERCFAERIHAYLSTSAMVVTHVKDVLKALSVLLQG